MNAAGIVLCGGHSTRMGSDKALLPFGPETMLQRVVRLLGTVVTPIVVAAAPGQLLPALPDGVILANDAHEDRGPLEGVRAGLQALPPTTSAAYVSGCDTPLLIPALVHRMLALLGDGDIAVLEVDGFLHPLAAVYRRTTLPHIEAMLARGELRTGALFDAVRTRRVRPEEVAAEDPGLLTLRNVNTRADYLEALSIANALR